MWLFFVFISFIRVQFLVVTKIKLNKKIMIIRFLCITNHKIEWATVVWIIWYNLYQYTRLNALAQACNCIALVQVACECPILAHIHPKYGCLTTLFLLESVQLCSVEWNLKEWWWSGWTKYMHTAQPRNALLVIDSKLYRQVIFLFHSTWHCFVAFL